MKRCKLLLAALLLMIMPFFGLKSVKAATTIEYMDDESDSVHDTDGNIYGDFDVYVAKASSGTKLQFNFLDQYYSYDQYMTAYIVHINLNNRYTGVIQVSMGTTWGSFENWWFDSDGSITSNASNTQGTGYWTLNLYDVQQATLVWLDQSAYNLNYVPQFLNGETNLVPSDPLDVNISGLADYQLPWYQVAAFAFATSTANNIIYEDGDFYPHVHITNGSSSRSLSVSANGSRHFVFISSANITSGKITSNNANALVTYSSVQPYTFGGGYRLYDLVLVNGANSSQTISMNYALDFDMIPIFFGSYEQMPEDVYSLVVGRHVYDQTLARILTALNALSDNASPSDQDTDLQDDVGDAIGGINIIENDFISQFQDSFGDIDLNNYSISSSLSRTVGWLTMNMQNIFARSGEFSILFTLPLVLGLALFFIGRGAVIFRQGNIDRAELKAELKNYNAQEYADKVYGIDDHSRSYHVASSRLSDTRAAKRSK